MSRIGIGVVASMVCVVAFCHACGTVGGPDIPFVLSPRAVVVTPASPASGDVALAFQLIDRELETADVTVEYSLDGGTIYASAILTNPVDALGLESAWHPGYPHAVYWDSVAEGLAISGQEIVCMRITPSDASNPNGTPGVTATFLLDNTAFNQIPVAAVTTPVGVQFGNIPIDYTLTDVESDICSITMEYTPNDGTNWYAATRKDIGEGITGLTSSAAGESHMFLWDSLADNVALAGQIDTVKVRVTPTDFHTGTPAETNLFSVDNTITNDPPLVSITTGPTEGATVEADTVMFEWNGTDTDGVVVGYYYSLDLDPPDTWTTGTSVTFTDLSEGPHTFRILALDDGYDVSPTVTRNFLIWTNEPPTDFYGDSVTPTSITWHWTDNSDTEDGFELQEQTDHRIADAPPNATSYVESGLTENSGYDRHCHAYRTEFAAIADGFDSGTLDGYNTGGSLPWSAATDEFHSGTHSAKSGAITDGQQSYLEKVVEIPGGGGGLSFWWKVSSEPTDDSLVFFIDYIEYSRISGEQDWAQANHVLNAGVHVLAWVYFKGASGASGGDCAWVDDISVPNAIMRRYSVPSGNDIQWTPIHDPTLNDYSVSNGEMSVRTIGTGTISYDVPLSKLFNFSRSQSLYLQSEVGTAGTIRKLKYYQSDSVSTTIQSVTFRISHTSLTTLSTWQGGDSGLGIQVFSGSITTRTSPGWIEITLSSPFAYNGTDNLLISARHQDNNYSDTYPEFDCTSTGVTMCLEAYDDVQNPPLTVEPLSFRPNVQIDLEISTDGVSIVAIEPPNKAVLQTGLRIERATNSAFTSNLTVLQDFTSTYNYTDYPPSGTYHYRIKYRNQQGTETAYSPSRSVTVP